METVATSALRRGRGTASKADPGETAASGFPDMSFSFRTAEDEIVALPLLEANRIDWREQLPVRTPGFHPDQKRNPGWIYSHSAGRLLPFESRLEFFHLLIADLRPEVVGMLTQPLRLHWRDAEGKALSHVPDALLELEDGTVELLNITTGTRKDRPKVALRLAAARHAAGRLGWRCRVAVDRPPETLLANVRLLAGCRRAPYGAAEIAPALLAAVRERTTIETAEAAVSEPVALVRPVLLHLLATGLLSCDLENPLTLDTQVARAKP